MLDNIIKQSVKLLTPASVIDSTFPGILEYAGRVCTATEDKVSEKPDYAFLRRLMQNQHLSVFEHCSITVELTTNRAISHQIVRHRIAAYSQQSMRYVKFSDKPGKEFRVIEPMSWDEWDGDNRYLWVRSLEYCMAHYEAMLDAGVKAEEARELLPHATATKLVATWNLRQLLHLLYDDKCGRFKNKHAQPMVRELFRLLYEKLKSESEFMKWFLETYEEVTYGANN